MLQIEVPISTEGWDEKNEVFVEPKVKILQLEHSLVSLSKWESKWNKPFLTKKDKTSEEVIDYVKCMTLTQNVHPDVYNHLSETNVQQIKEYIKLPMTATTFSDDGKGKSTHRVVTAELIYYWMIAHNIPFDCQKWHINKLLTLIRVCNVESQPRKKRSNGQIMRSNHALNMARRQKFNSRG